MKYKGFMRELKYLSNNSIEDILKQTLLEIKFLESIYMINGENHSYSEKFSNSAYKERQGICQLASACFKTLDERRENKVEHNKE